jgi:hypothetical protein
LGTALAEADRVSCCPQVRPFADPPRCLRLTLQWNGRCVLPRDRLCAFLIRRLACETCRAAGSGHTLLLHDRNPLIPDLPSGFLRLANWSAGARYVNELTCLIVSSFQCSFIFGRRQ